VIAHAACSLLVSGFLFSDYDPVCFAAIFVAQVVNACCELGYVEADLSASGTFQYGFPDAGAIYVAEPESGCCSVCCHFHGEDRVGGIRVDAYVVRFGGYGYRGDHFLKAGDV